MKYLVTNRHVVIVEVLSDGRLMLSADGDSIMPDMGLFIKNCGGRKKLLGKCVESEVPFDVFKKDIMERKAECKRIRRQQYLTKLGNKEFNILNAKDND